MSAPSSPSIVFLGGRIHTLDDRLGTVQALAIAGDRILAAGADGEASALAGPRTEVIRLAGRTVLPGLMDAHVHLQQYAGLLEQVDCATPTLKECLERVRLRAASAPPEAWILGHGWNQNDWGRFGDREELDAVSAANPVYLTARSLHAGWANSRALELAGIRAATPDPEGGRILRDGAGEPTGLLLEAATSLIDAVLPHPTLETTAHALENAQSRLWELGLTGIHDFDGPECLDALRLLRDRGSLGLRVVKNIRQDQLPDALASGIRTGLGDAWIRFGNIKVFADGALGPHTASMLEPYAGEPANFGLALVSSEELLDLGVRAARGGLALSVHAIGDRANRTVLDAFERLRAREPETLALRHRIEHVQLLHPEDIPRLAKLRLIASMQPIHASSDMTMADRYWGSRVRHAYAWRSVLQAGAVLAFGSDAPVESPNPFWGIHCALTRRREDGSPGPEGWVPEERLDIHQALRAYTLGPAIAAGTQGTQGRLAPGFLADLIVLDADPLTTSPDEMIGVRPSATMVGGVFRYRAFEG